MAKHFALQPAAYLAIEVEGYNPRKQAELMRKKQRKTRLRYEQARSADQRNAAPVSPGIEPAKPHAADRSPSRTHSWTPDYDDEDLKQLNDALTQPEPLDEQLRRKLLMCFEG